MRKSVNVILSVIILVLLFSGCAKRPDPEEAVQAFLDSLKHSQYAEMYQMLTTEAKERFTEEQFVNKYQEVYEQVGILKIELQMQKPPTGDKWPIEDNRVNVEIKGEMHTWTVDEINLNQTLKMVYEEKVWLVDWSPTNILPQLTDLSYKVDVSRTPAQRGNIYDRGGQQLAGLGKIYRIGLVPGKMLNWDETIYLIADLLDITPDYVKNMLQQKWVKPDLFVPLRSISSEEWLAKRDELIAIPGMLASSSEGRIYSAPISMGPTLGYLGEVNRIELEQWTTRGYELGDKVGRTGLEESEEAYLLGKHGYMIRLVDQAGTEQAMVKFTRPLDGGDIFLTIDSNLQQIIEKAMGDRRGAVVAIVPGTGEVLALGSFPGYDANEFMLGSSLRITQLLNDPEKPLINRPLQGKYIPGSTFKPITALAALEFYPQFDPTQEVNLLENTWRAEPGWGSYSVRRVKRPEGPVDLTSAMKWSDNIYFAQLAYMMGSEPLFQITERLGFEEKIPFKLPVEKSILSTKRPIPNTILLADTGYGQGQVLMTPLHLALIYSAIATDGKIHHPVILTSEDRGIIFKDVIASEENLNLLKEVLKNTVQDPTASAHVVTIPGLDLAGKTGTAQVGNDQENGWFICYTPAPDPDFLLVVGIEDVSGGSKEAIKVAREILLKYYQVMGE